MKTFQLSDDRMVTAKKNLVTIKQKNSDKAFEFTPTRYLLCSITLPSTILMSPAYITMFSLIRKLLLCCYRWAAFQQMFEEIDATVSQLCGDEPVKFQAHIGGGQYVSVTSGYKRFRTFYVPFDQLDVRPTKEGIALRLHEWANMRTIVDSINDDFPTLAGAIPCYMQTDHQDPTTAIACRECFPFSN